MSKSDSACQGDVTALGEHPTLSRYFATIFPGKVRKIAVNAGLGCPNRDGTLGTGGCIFCNNAAFVPRYALGSDGENSGNCPSRNDKTSPEMTVGGDFCRPAQNIGENLRDEGDYTERNSFDKERNGGFCKPVQSNVCRPISSNACRPAPSTNTCRPTPSITEQIDRGIEFSRGKGEVWGYLPYFQSYSNTYGDTRHLIGLYEEALRHPGVVGLVIATRPDCLAPDLLDYFEQRFGNKPRQCPEQRFGSEPRQCPEQRFGNEAKGHPARQTDSAQGPYPANCWNIPFGQHLEPYDRWRTDRPYLLVEIGIESTNDGTLRRINRGHDFACCRDAVRALAERGIDVGAHIILGLPGEGPSDFVLHAERLSELPLRTLKLHHLQVVRNTALEQMYRLDPGIVHLFTPEEYAATVHLFLDHLRSGIVLDRFVTETPPGMVVAPAWGLKPSEFQALL